MTIEVKETKLAGVRLITPDIHTDLRGRNVTLYSKRMYEEKGINLDFVENKVSVSRHNVLRGIHGDNNTWKLISCLSGVIFLVVVNCDEMAPEFGAWESFTLSGDDFRQVLVPPKYGNGHLVMSDLAIFYYQWSAYYDLSNQFSYKYNDSRFTIAWPVTDPILFGRDKV